MHKNPEMAAKWMYNDEQDDDSKKPQILEFINQTIDIYKKRGIELERENGFLKDFIKARSNQHQNDMIHYPSFKSEATLQAHKLWRSAVIATHPDWVKNDKWTITNHLWVIYHRNNAALVSYKQDMKAIINEDLETVLLSWQKAAIFPDQQQITQKKVQCDESETNEFKWSIEFKFTSNKVGLAHKDRFDLAQNENIVGSQWLFEPSIQFLDEKIKKEGKGLKKTYYIDACDVEEQSKTNMIRNDVDYFQWRGENSYINTTKNKQKWIPKQYNDNDDDRYYHEDSNSYYNAHQNITPHPQYDDDRHHQHRQHQAASAYDQQQQRQRQPDQAQQGSSTQPQQQQQQRQRQQDQAQQIRPNQGPNSYQQPQQQRRPYHAPQQVQRPNHPQNVHQPQDQRQRQPNNAPIAYQKHFPSMPPNNQRKSHHQ